MICIAYSVTWGHIISRPVLQSWTMSRSMALLHPGSTVMLMVHATTKSHTDVGDLGYPL